MKKCLLVLLTMLFAMFFGLQINTVTADDITETLSGRVDFIFLNGTYSSNDGTITWDSQYMTMKQEKYNSSTSVSSNNVSTPVWAKSQRIVFTPKENVTISRITIVSTTVGGTRRLSNSTWSIGSVNGGLSAFILSDFSTSNVITCVLDNNTSFGSTSTLKEVYYEYETTVTQTSVSLSKTSASLDQGATLQLEAVVHALDDANKSVTWESNNTDIATVDSNGLVTAKYFSSVDYPDGRDVTITAKTPDNATATCTVHVRTLAETQDTLRIYHQLSFSYVRELSENITYKIQSTDLILDSTGSYLDPFLDVTENVSGSGDFSIEYKDDETRSYFYIYTVVNTIKKYLGYSENLVLSEFKADTANFLWYLDIDGFIANKSNDFILAEKNNSFSVVSKKTDGYLPCYFIGEKNEVSFDNVSITYQLEANDEFYNGVVAKFGTSNLKTKFIVNNKEYISDIYYDDARGVYFSRFTVTDIPQEMWNTHFTVTAKLVAYETGSSTNIIVEGNTIVEENLYSVTDIANKYVISHMDNENVKNIAYYLTKLISSVEVARVD